MAVVAASNLNGWIPAFGVREYQKPTTNNYWAPSYTAKENYTVYDKSTEIHY